MIERLVRLYRQIKPRARYYLPVIPLGVAVATLAFIYRQNQVPTLFSSTAKMVISGKVNLPETANAYTEELANFIGTQIEILGSQVVVTRAKRKLQLDRPELRGTATVQARPLRGTTIIIADAIGSDPDYTTAFLQALLEQFIEFRKDRRIQTTDAALRQIREEIPRTEQQLAADEEAVFKFKLQHNLGDWEREAADAGLLLSQLRSREANLRMQLELAQSLKERAVTQAREDRILALTAFDGTQRRSATIAERAPAAEIDPRREELIKLQVEREQLLTIFQPQHPRIRKLDLEIQRQSRLVDLLAVERDRSFAQMVTGMQSELAVIGQAIKDCQHKALESAHAAAEYERLQANVTRSREVNSRLVSGLQNVDVAREVNLDIVQVLQQPSAALRVPKPLAEATRGGIFVGLLSGVVLFLGLQRFDRRAFSGEEVAAASAAPIVSEIPSLAELADPAYDPLRSGPSHRMLEAMRGLASSIDLTTETSRHRTAVFCSSCTPGEGKSTVALNLALYLEKSGLKTLLIDADLRCGSLAERLSLPRDHAGMADLVMGKVADWRETVVPVPGTQLHFIGSGNTQAETVDFLGRWLNPKFFEQLKVAYDVVVVDSAPLVPVADSVGFLPYMDQVLLISRVRVTQLSLLEKTAAIIRQHSRNNFRLVVNEMETDPHLYGYGYTQPA